MAEKREMGSMCKKNLKNILQKLKLCFFSKQYIYIYIYIYILLGLTNVLQQNTPKKFENIL